ncbi:hypothetical protein ACFL54_08520, partial [Planctomycetota bacterium]
FGVTHTLRDGWKPAKENLYRRFQEEIQNVEDKCSKESFELAGERLESEINWLFAVQDACRGFINVFEKSVWLDTTIAGEDSLSVDEMEYLQNKLDELYISLKESGSDLIDGLEKHIPKDILELAEFDRVVQAVRFLESTEE